MSAQRFIFCVGAAKAGTSWLFDYLYHHPDCYFPALKELHYWDSLEARIGGFYRRRASERLERLEQKRAKAKKTKTAAYRDQAIADNRRWLDVFDGKTRDDAAYLTYLGQDRPGAKVIGDFTPAYATLEDASLKRMATLTDDVRFVYLMRDPVERAWSQLRMDATDETEALAKFDDFLAGGEKHVVARSDYRAALTKLRAVVQPGRLYFEFFERLFTPAAIERLCTFLGIRTWPASFGKTINVSQSVALDPARRMRARALLKPQYDYVGRLIGELPPEWTGKMVNA